MMKSYHSRTVPTKAAIPAFRAFVGVDATSLITPFERLAIVTPDHPTYVRTITSDSGVGRSALPSIISGGPFAFRARRLARLAAPARHTAGDRCCFHHLARSFAEPTLPHACAVRRPGHRWRSCASRNRFESSRLA